MQYFYFLRSYFHFTLQASKREQDYDEKIKSLENEYGEVMNCGWFSVYSRGKTLFFFLGWKTKVIAVLIWININLIMPW